MKRTTTLAVVLGLSFASTAFAQEAGKEALSAEKNLATATPVAMSDEQLDSLSAGLLDGINVAVVDVADITNNNVNVQLNVPVSAAVAAFGSTAGSVATALPGRIFQ